MNKSCKEMGESLLPFLFIQVLFQIIFGYFTDNAVNVVLDLSGDW